MLPTHEYDGHLEDRLLLFRFYLAAALNFLSFPEFSSLSSNSPIELRKMTRSERGSILLSESSERRTDGRFTEEPQADEKKTLSEAAGSYSLLFSFQTCQGFDYEVVPTIWSTKDLLGPTYEIFRSRLRFRNFFFL